jgi:hypothetical protein
MRGYPAADIDGTFSEGRYQGCSAWLLDVVGEPWALYSATRIPGEETPLNWKLALRGRRWGAMSPFQTLDHSGTRSSCPDGLFRLEGATSA